jgi:hypothetical protein
VGAKYLCLVQVDQSCCQSTLSLFVLNLVLSIASSLALVPGTQASLAIHRCINLKRPVATSRLVRCLVNGDLVSGAEWLAVGSDSRQNRTL